MSVYEFKLLLQANDILKITMCWQLLRDFVQFVFYLVIFLYLAIIFWMKYLIGFTVILILDGFSLISNIAKCVHERSERHEIFITLTSLATKGQIKWRTLFAFCSFVVMKFTSRVMKRTRCKTRYWTRFGHSQRKFDKYF